MGTGPTNRVPAHISPAVSFASVPCAATLGSPIVGTLNFEGLDNLAVNIKSVVSLVGHGNPPGRLRAGRIASLLSAPWDRPEPIISHSRPETSL